MSQDLVVSLGREALTTVLLLAAPVLGLSLLTGLVISVFQATTQIHEQTLAFVPKIVAVLVGVGLFGPWMMGTMIDFTRRIYELVPQLVR
jgi:flagellar biosynthetic protein FliQ